MYENSFKDSDWRGFWNPVCQGSAGNAENGEIIYSCRKEYHYNSTPVPALDCAENLPCATDYEMTLYELLRNVIPEEYRKTVAGICIDATL